MIFSGISALIGLAGGLGQAAALEEAAADNFELELDNAETRRDFGIAGALTRRSAQRIGYLETAINFGFEAMENMGRRRNIRRLSEEIEYRTEQDRENINRSSEAFERMQGSQRAVIGASGAVGELSGAEVIADSAEQFTMSMGDLYDEMTYNRAAGLSEVANQQYALKWSRYKLKANRRSFKRTRKLEGFANYLEKSGIRAQYSSDVGQAMVNRQLMEAQADGVAANAVAGAISGIGGMISGVMGGASGGAPTTSFQGFMPSGSSAAQTSAAPTSVGVSGYTMPVYQYN